MRRTKDDMPDDDMCRCSHDLLAVASILDRAGGFLSTKHGHAFVLQGFSANPQFFAKLQDGTPVEVSRAGEIIRRPDSA